MAGAPDPKFFDGMKAEHCSKAGFDLEFTTPNYHFVTTASQEWQIVVERAACQPQNMGHGRVIRDLEECYKLGQTQGNLKKEEVIAVVLYTGPMVICLSLHCFVSYIFVSIWSLLSVFWIFVTVLHLWNHPPAISC